MSKTPLRIVGLLFSGLLLFGSGPWSVGAALAQDEGDRPAAESEAEAPRDAAERNAAADPDAADDEPADRRRLWEQRWRERQARMEREVRDDRGPGFGDRPPHGGPPERGMDGPRGFAPPLDPEQQRQALAVLRDLAPHMAERIAEALETGRPRAELLLRRMYPRLHRLVELRREDERLYELKVADQRQMFEWMHLRRQIVDAHRDGDEARLAELRDQARTKAREHFALRQELREHELARLEQRMEELRDELAERRAQKDQLVEQHLDRLFAPPGDDDGDKPWDREDRDWDDKARDRDKDGDRDRDGDREDRDRSRQP